MAVRSLHSAVILAVGSELTTGATRDTNSGDLARELLALGVEVLYTTALPDRLRPVADAFARAIAEADLVISTGGLGPTPDDLTREAICAATGVQPTVDADLERWLRELFRRRGLEMPDSNLKQAWLIPGAFGLRNDHGTAPGWWLELPSATLVIALPGPPREMWPIWRDAVRPRLLERGLGGEVEVRTLRLAGIGESALVELIGEEVLRAADPEVATYARPDAVDLRITARGPRAAERVTAAVEALRPRLADYLFAEGEDDWPDVIGRVLGPRRLACVEIGTGGQIAAMLGAEPWFAGGELVPARAAPGLELAALAERIRARTGADVGLAVRARERDVDTVVEIAIADAETTFAAEQTAFLAGREGRRRAALVACTVLWRRLKAG